MSLLIFRVLLISSLFMNISMELQLQLVNVIFRHGDRTPKIEYINQFPNFPNKDVLLSLPRSGQLTTFGERRAKVLGQHIHKLYKDFLGNDYSKEKVSAISTTAEQVQESLQSVLKELYRNDRVEDGVFVTLFDRIPFEILENERDFLIPQCKSFKEEVLTLMKVPEIRKRGAAFQYLMIELSHHLGTRISDLTQVYGAWDSLKSQYHMILPLPSWVNDVLKKKTFLDAVVLSYDLCTYTESLKRMTGGKVLKYFVDKIHSKINGTDSDKKINLIAAPHFHIATLVRTLKLMDNQIPEFTSGVFIELLSESNVYYVKIRYYKGIPSDVSEEIKIPECSDPCPFQQFLKLYETVTATDATMNCEKEHVNAHNLVDT